jgi:putative sigma-54 modulation protein
VRTIVRGKNLAVSEGDRAYIERKMLRLERMLDDRSEALVVLSVEPHKSDGDSCIVDVSLVVDGRPIHGTAAGPSHHAAMDEVVDKLERQAVDHRERPRLRSRPTEEKEILRTLADGTADSDTASATSDPRVVKVKRFAIEPMFEEDAVTRMEELGHSFFVFVNAENERLGVLYRRRDGDYGLIEPEAGESGHSASGRRR